MEILINIYSILLKICYQFTTALLTGGLCPLVRSNLGLGEWWWLLPLLQVRLKFHD